MMPIWLLESINTFYWCQPHQWQYGGGYNVTASELSSWQGPISIILFFNFDLAVIQSLLIRSLTTTHSQNSCCIMGNILGWSADEGWDDSELKFPLNWIYNNEIVSEKQRQPYKIASRMLNLKSFLNVKYEDCPWNGSFGWYVIHFYKLVICTIL